MINLDDFPSNDFDWTEEHWHQLLIFLNENGLATYKEIASTVLSALNPPQVGTQVASKPSFQRHFPPRQTMVNVMRWFYAREGLCVDCGSRLELQADHIIPKETFDNPEDADFLDNLELRCRRCNVIKRPSHKNGGKTYLTAAAALMWLLFKHRPKSYAEYETICREYGLTMANVRFHEAWAMAVWLNRIGKYDIDE
jgi:hypothetical protein